MFLLVVQRFFVTILILSFAIYQTQDMTITGKQAKETSRGKPKQSCTPVKISAKMMVSEVDGKCKGFWIQKGSETVYKFDNKEDAIGTTLTPGIYYVYPYLEDDENKATVTITIKRAGNTN
jgi:hypothetical protein